MSPSPDSAPLESLTAATLRLLRPLVRLLLRYGVPYGEFADLAKRCYVDIARDDFRIAGRKQTRSRISVLTGLSRKEVRRIESAPCPSDAEPARRYNRAARVISGWTRDPSFHDAGGKPRALEIDGSAATFAALVREYSGDVPARAVLDELVRVGAVVMDEDGRAHLLARAYVPATGEADKLAILGSDVADLISCIDHNLTSRADDRFFQRKVSYDNLPNDAAQVLRPLAAKRAQSLLEELDAWMSAHDRDATPGIVGRGRRRASLGIYYFEQGLDEESE